MVLTLRLSDEQTAALEAQAAREGRSVHEVVVLAVEARVAAGSRTERLDQVLDEQLPRYAEALERLGQ